jgi:hypothetical protein
MRRRRKKKKKQCHKSLQLDNNPKADEPILFLSLHIIGHLKTRVCTLSL